MEELSVKLDEINDSMRQFKISTQQGEITTPAMLTKHDNSIILFENSQTREENQIQLKEGNISSFPHVIPEFKRETIKTYFKKITGELKKDLISISYYPDPSVYESLRGENIKILFLRDVGKKVTFRDFSNFITGLRSFTAIDTTFALFSPIHEEWIPFLSYLGLDIVNIDPFLLQVWKKGENSLLQNTYFGWNTNLEKETRRTNKGNIDRIKGKNRSYLNLLFERLRYFSKKGATRNFLETWAHLSHKTDGMLTILDNEKQEFLSKYLSLSKTRKHDFIGEESFHRPIVKYYNKKIRNEYVPPTPQVLLFLPCAARKPYSQSPSHRDFINAIHAGIGYSRYKLHEIMITSPFGIIPRELEATPPAVNYDITVTGHWSEKELNHTADLVKSYIRKQKRQNQDFTVLLHLTGGYLEAVKRGLEGIGIEYSVTAKGHPRKKKSLSCLTSELERITEKTINQEKWRERARENIRACLSYQFNDEISKKLVVNGRAVGKPQTERWRISNTIHFSPMIGGFVPLKRGGRIFSQTRKWTIKLKRKPQREILLSTNIQRTGDLRPGEIFVGTLDDNPIIAGEALIPGEEMKDARKTPVAKVVRRFY